jgi:hypothetical protein
MLHIIKFKIKNNLKSTYTDKGNFSLCRTRSLAVLNLYITQIYFTLSICVKLILLFDFSHKL